MPMHYFSLRCLCRKESQAPVFAPEKPVPGFLLAHLRSKCRRSGERHGRIAPGACGEHHHNVIPRLHHQHLLSPDFFSRWLRCLIYSPLANLRCCSFFQTILHCLHNSSDNPSLSTNRRLSTISSAISISLSALTTRSI